MKQHIFMRSGVLLAVIAAFLTFFACRKDLQETNLQPQTPVSEDAIQAAKTWFDQNGRNASIPDFKNIEPLWEKAKIAKDALQIPYTANGKTGMPKLSNDLNKLGRQRLVLLKNTTGYSAYLVSFLPSDNFKGDVKTLTVRNLVSENFDGIISYQKWNEKILHNWYYTNGKVTKRAIAKIAHETSAKATNMQCEWYEQCTDWFQCSGELGGTLECTFLDRTCVEWCEGGDDGGGDDGGGGGYGCEEPPCGDGNGDTGGGGGGSDPCNGPNPPANCNQCVCTKQSTKLFLGNMWFDLAHGDYIELLLTSMDCKTGNAQKDMVHTIRSSYPNGVTFSNEIVQIYYKVPIDPSKPDCGFNLTYYAHCIVTCTVWLPSQQNMPIPLVLDTYANTNID